VVFVVELNVAPEEELDDEVAGRGVVPDTTEGAKPAAVVMSVSSDADIDAGARSEHAAIGSSRDRSGQCGFVADHQPLCVAAGFVAVVLAR
jgi:hypothetical protein